MPRPDTLQRSLPVQRLVGVLAVSSAALLAQTLERTVLADFADATERSRWHLQNAGAQSAVEPLPGVDGRGAVHVTCVAEPGLSPQAHSPAPYMPYRREFDGGAAARAGMTRLTFRHRGAGVQIVFSEKDRGTSWYAQVDSSPDWRTVALPLAEFAWGWNSGGPDTGHFDLARMEALHAAVTPKPGETLSYALADIALERHADDIEEEVPLGSPNPSRLELFPADLAVPVNCTQPVLAIVSNDLGRGLAGHTVELAVAGAGRLSPLADRAGSQAAAGLRLTSDATGKVQARFHPGDTPGAAGVLSARLVDAAGVVPVQVTLRAAPPLAKVRFGADGRFHRPDGTPCILLGGLFLPWWGKIENHVMTGMSPMSILGASEAEQRAWFAYLRDHGVNCVRGYWPWGAPLKIGPDGSEVVHAFNLGPRLNEPVVAALERTLAIGGECGIGVVLTIADSARPILAPRGRIPAGSSRRQVTQEAIAVLRAFVPRLRFNPNVWGLELTNEQNWGIFPASERFIQAIKELDDETPVMVSHWGGALQTADPVPWMGLTGIDLYQPHMYPDRGHSLWGPEADSGLLQEVHYNGMLGPKPWFLGESGGYGTHPPLGRAPDAVTQQYLARDCIWFALLNRSAGASIWGIMHDATTQFRMAAAIAPEVDWAALARTRATLGVAVPRDVTGDGFFRSAAGKEALKVMAAYARWGLRHGVSLDFPLDAAGYACRASALEPFVPPTLEPPFRLAEGWELKTRQTADGGLLVGYLRNTAGGIELYKPETPAGSAWTVTGSYIRRRQAAAPDLRWTLPRPAYVLSLWDLDSGRRQDLAVPGTGGAWNPGPIDHDFVLVWKAKQAGAVPGPQGGRAP